MVFWEGTFWELSDFRAGQERGVEAFRTVSELEFFFRDLWGVSAVDVGQGRAHGGDDCGVRVSRSVCEFDRFASGDVSCLGVDSLVE